MYGLLEGHFGRQRDCSVKSKRAEKKPNRYLRYKTVKNDSMPGFSSPQPKLLCRCRTPGAEKRTVFLEYAYGTTKQTRWQLQYSFSAGTIPSPLSCYACRLSLVSIPVPTHGAWADSRQIGSNIPGGASSMSGVGILGGRGAGGGCASQALSLAEKLQRGRRAGSAPIVGSGRAPEPCEVRCCLAINCASD